MTKGEYTRIQTIIDQTNRLMDAGPYDGRNVSNVDVIEALIGDLGKLVNNRPPMHLAELLARPSTREV